MAIVKTSQRITNLSLTLEHEDEVCAFAEIIEYAKSYMHKHSTGSPGAMDLIRKIEEGGVKRK